MIIIKALPNSDDKLCRDVTYLVSALSRCTQECAILLIDDQKLYNSIEEFVRPGSGNQEPEEIFYDCLDYEIQDVTCDLTLSTLHKFPIEVVRRVIVQSPYFNG